METTETANSQLKDDELEKGTVGAEEPTYEQQNTDNQPNDDELEKSSVGAEEPIEEQQNTDNQQGKGSVGAEEPIEEQQNTDNQQGKGSVGAEEPTNKQQQNTEVRIETAQQQELDESGSVGPEPTDEQQQNTDNQPNDDGLEKDSVGTEEPTGEQQQNTEGDERTETDQQQELDESTAATANEEDNEPKPAEQSDPIDEPEPATLGSSTLLQDLLRNHSSEIGNWADMVGSLPQDDPSATSESFKSKRAQYDIPHQGPFKLFVTNLNLPPNVRKPNPNHRPYDPNRSEFGRMHNDVFQHFGGPQNLLSAYFHFPTSQGFCMLEARDFESCIRVLRKDGEPYKGKPAKVEYVVPNMESTKHAKFTPVQLDAQLEAYKEARAPPQAAEKPVVKSNPFGEAKPINMASKYNEMQAKLDKERAERKARDRQQMPSLSEDAADHQTGSSSNSKATTPGPHDQPFVMHHQNQPILPRLMRRQSQDSGGSHSSARPPSGPTQFQPQQHYVGVSQQSHATNMSPHARSFVPTSQYQPRPHQPQFAGGQREQQQQHHRRPQHQDRRQSQPYNQQRPPRYNQTDGPPRDEAAAGAAPQPRDQRESIVSNKSGAPRQHMPSLSEDVADQTTGSSSNSKATTPGPHDQPFLMHHQNPQFPKFLRQQSQNSGGHSSARPPSGPPQFQPQHFGGVFQHSLQQLHHGRVILPTSQYQSRPRQPQFEGGQREQQQLHHHRPQPDRRQGQQYNQPRPPRHGQAGGPPRDEAAGAGAAPQPRDQRPPKLMEGFDNQPQAGQPMRTGAAAGGGPRPRGDNRQQPGQQYKKQPNRRDQQDQQSWPTGGGGTGQQFPEHGGRNNNYRPAGRPQKSRSEGQTSPPPLQSGKSDNNSTSASADQQQRNNNHNNNHKDRPYPSRRQQGERVFTRRGGKGSSSFKPEPQPVEQKDSTASEKSASIEQQPVVVQQQSEHEQHGGNHRDCGASEPQHQDAGGAEAVEAKVVDHTGGGGGGDEQSKKKGKNKKTKKNNKGEAGQAVKNNKYYVLNEVTDQDQ